MKGVKKYRLPVIKGVSHEDEKYSTGNIVSNVVITSYGDHSCLGEPCVICRIV